MRPVRPDAALHFVGDEQDAVRVAERAQLGEPTGGRDDVAAFALDRFDEDRRDVFRPRQMAEERLLDCARLAVWRVVDAGQQRTEAAAVARLARGERQAAERTAVERAVERDDVRSTRWRAE